MASRTLLTLACLLLLAVSAHCRHNTGSGFSERGFAARMLESNTLSGCSSSSGESGAARCWIDLGASELHCDVFHTVSAPTDIEVYVGQPGTVGSLLFTFTGTLTGHVSQTFAIEVDDDDTFENEFFNGNWYIEVFSSACIGGAIRGQFDAEHNVYSILNGDNEVPAIATSNSGIAVAKYNGDPRSRLLESFISHSIPDSQSTVAAIELGEAGSNGVQIDTFQSANSEVSGAFKLTSGTNGQDEAIFNDETYYTVGSQSHLGGEIRGQLRVMDSIPRVNYAFRLLGEHELPPVDTDANGFAIFAVNCRTAELEYTIIHNIPDADAAHVHMGNMGQTGDVVFPLNRGKSPITGKVSLTTDVFKALSAEGLYVNIHSPAHPTGELRGQIISEFPYYAYGSGEQVAPDRVASSSKFVGGFLLKTLDGGARIMSSTVAHNMAAVSGSDASIATGTFIDNAIFGENGSPVLDLGLDNDGYAELASRLITNGEEQQFRNGQWYIEFNSARFPDGEIRGQIYQAFDACEADDLYSEDTFNLYGSSYYSLTSASPLSSASPIDQPSTDNSPSSRSDSDTSRNTRQSFTNSANIDLASLFGDSSFKDAVDDDDRNSATSLAASACVGIIAAVLFLA